MSRISRIVPWVIGAAAAAAALPLQAQSNLDAGKSAAQIFADTCNACHRSPRELRQTNAGFLRQHYTTGVQEAAIMAGYLASVGSDARAVQQRRPPTLGTGQTSATESAPRGGAAGAPDRGRNPETQAALPATAPGHRPPGTSEPAQSATAPIASFKPRRPSESVETGKLPSDAMPGRGVEAAPPQAAAARPSTSEAFEE